MNKDMFGEQFYPTPIELAIELLNDVDFSKVQYVLEPSAGKGNLVEAVKACAEKTCYVDCLEIDSDLQSVLRGRGYTVVGDDFLQYQTWQKYDLCVMNPPFKQGDRHLLKALEVMKRGGQIVCILNTETIRNACTDLRLDLLQKLDDYGAEIRYLSNAFSGAERKTDVEIAIVRVNIPDVAERDVTRDLKGARDNDYGDCAGCNELADNDFIRASVKQFEISCAAGIQIFDNARTLEKYLPSGKAALIEVQAVSPEETSISQANKFIRQLRFEFWKRLFRSSQMSGLMTNSIRESYMSQLQKMRDYDFSYYNIKQMQLELSESLKGNIEKAIVDMFEQLTYESSMENSKNRHYYNGWRTNKAFAINKKVIVPIYGLFDSRWGGSWSFWQASDFLIELEKVLNYLDGGLTNGSGVYDVVRNGIERNSYAGEFVKFKYFSVSFKKKGTIHIQFDDLELLKKFNIFGSQQKGWLPPSYGKEKYTSMTAEEKEVVKSFEGEKEYSKVLQNTAYYLGDSGLKMLCG